MTSLEVRVEVLGPWSLATSRAFQEGFAPTALTAQIGPGCHELHSVFLAESDLRRAEVTAAQDGSTATVQVTGDGDLAAAAAQVCRFLALDVDARTWPDVGRRDPVIADAQAKLPGLRPCGFHSPYEAAAWAVLSQRIRIVQAARLRADLVARHGLDGAFPPPQLLRNLDLDLPGRKTEYLSAVAEAALDGQLLAVPLAMGAPGPATRPALTLLQFLLRPANAALAGCLLLGILHPADELVATQRRDVHPGSQRCGAGKQRGAKVGGKSMHRPAGHWLAGHTATIAGRSLGPPPLRCPVVRSGQACLPP